MSVRNVPNPREEIRLVDIVRDLVRYRKLAVGTFLFCLLGSVGLTLAAQPEYEARASFLMLNEKDAILALIESEAYAATVADVAGLTDELGGGNRMIAAKSIMEHVEIRTGERGEPANLVVVHASASTGERAATLANAYVTTLDDWRSFLVNMTRESQWAKYYEQAGKDARRAESQLTNLTREMQYTQSLDAASPAASPVRPNWSTNLTLGVALGTMGAVAVPLLVRAVADVLAGRRAKKPPVPPLEAEL